MVVVVVVVVSNNNNSNNWNVIYKGDLSAQQDLSAYEVQSVIAEDGLSCGSMGGGPRPTQAH